MTGPAWADPSAMITRIVLRRSISDGGSAMSMLTIGANVYTYVGRCRSTRRQKREAEKRRWNTQLTPLARAELNAPEPFPWNSGVTNRQRSVGERPNIAT